MTDNITQWYRVVGFGASGAVQRCPEAAWESFYRLASRRYGYGPADRGTAVSAHSARLVIASTRRAAEAADVSLGPSGRVGRGWWEWAS